MQDEKPNEKQHTGFEYLGPQSEHAEELGALPPLPRRLKAHPMPVEGKEPVTEYGNIDLHFSWPELERVENLSLADELVRHVDDPNGDKDDEWAGKDYKHPGGNA